MSKVVILNSTRSGGSFVEHLFNTIFKEDEFYKQDLYGARISPFNFSPDKKYVYIWREDKVGQAVSRFLAQMTMVWSISESGAVVYRDPSIKNKAADIYKKALIENNLINKLKLYEIYARYTVLDNFWKEKIGIIDNCLSISNEELLEYRVSDYRNLLSFCGSEISDDELLISLQSTKGGMIIQHEHHKEIYVQTRLILEEFLSETTRHSTE
jgi:hypothetical protein